MSIDFTQINYLAVVVAIIINMAAGALWYSPVLLGRTWMKETGITEQYIEEHRGQAYKGYLGASPSIV